MTKSNFKFSNIIFYASILLGIVYFACKIEILHFYRKDNFISEIINSLNSTYLFINTIFISLFLFYLSKINKKLKILSLKFKMNLQRTGIFNYSVSLLLIILLIHLTIWIVLKISFIKILFINNWSQKLLPVVNTFLIINLIIFIISLTIYTFLMNFSIFLNKLSSLLRLEKFIKKSIKLLFLLIKWIKIKNIVNNLKLINNKLLINFKVNYILVNVLQWQEILRKSQKLTTIKKACAPGNLSVF